MGPAYGYKCPTVGLVKECKWPPAEQVNKNRSQIIVFYTICNSSNRFLTATTTTFSRTLHVFLCLISRLQVETIVQIFAYVAVEPYATFKVRKDRVVFDNAHSRTDLLWQLPHRWEGEVKKCPKNAWEMSGLGNQRTAMCKFLSEIILINSTNTLPVSILTIPPYHSRQKGK